MTDNIQILIPDIGGAADVDVIDILVQVGDNVSIDQSLITLEGDKATMDIPSSHAGVVEEILIKLGDKVSQGTPILRLKSDTPGSEEAVSIEKPVSSVEIVTPVVQSEPVATSPALELMPQVIDSIPAFAGPAVRRLAREFGVDLSRLQGSGRKSRITKEDLQSYVKKRLSETPSSNTGFSLPTIPDIDFSKFGDIELKPLNKIKRLTATNVHRSWITIPHVTQFDEADITDLEAFRKAEADQGQKAGYKLTILAFVCKVVSKALAIYPQFNASLDKSGEQLIYKKYCHIGIAVETPNGLVVPVIQSVNQLSIGEIAQEMARLSTKARDKGLGLADMSGGCFTISSLGGIGGTAFTPIVNSPEVAILGLSRASIKPVYREGGFVPRLQLPLSLSYDHRVIDGAEAARFTRYIADALSDIRRILL